MIAEALQHKCQNEMTLFHSSHLCSLRHHNLQTTMAYPRFKQRCAICKKNMVIMYSGRQFPICSSCHMRRISEPITDPKYQKFFDVPVELYEKSSFLRNIKESYQRFGSLTLNQKKAFLKVVEDVKKPRLEALAVAEQPVIDQNISLRAQRLAKKAKKEKNKKVIKTREQEIK